MPATQPSEEKKKKKKRNQKEREIRQGWPACYTTSEDVGTSVKERNILLLGRRQHKVGQGRFGLVMGRKEGGGPC